MKRTIYLISAVVVLILFGAMPALGVGQSAKFPNVFKGYGYQLCTERGLGGMCLGQYSNDKVVMKWNDEWARGKAESWSVPPYDASLKIRWNGKIKGGTGDLFRYRIDWMPDKCSPELSKLPGGGYCLWGHFKLKLIGSKDVNAGPGPVLFPLGIL
jgi:hypothetical protein